MRENRKVIVKRPGQEIEVICLLRSELEGVEVSGPEFIFFESGVKVYQWSLRLETELRKWPPRCERNWAEKYQCSILERITPIFPPPPPPSRPIPLTNQQLVAMLMEHPDYMPVIYDADNGIGDHEAVTNVWHDDQAKQTHICSNLYGIDCFAFIHNLERRIS